MLPELTRTFERRGALDRLPPIIFWRRQEWLDQLDHLAAFLHLCERTGQAQRFRPQVADWIASSEAPRFRFTANDYLHSHGQLAAEDLILLLHAKYRRLPSLAPERIVDGASILADQIKLDPRVMARLFERRRDRSASFDEWLREVAIAHCVDHVLSDVQFAFRAHKQYHDGPDALYQRLARGVELARLIDLDDARTRLAAFDDSKGLLLYTFHGAFFLLMRRLYRDVRSGNVVLAARAGGNRIGTANRQVAAFAAVKMLKQGKTLLIAADGPVGEGAATTSELEVVGTRTKIVDGAPFMAYESGCNTAWFTVIRNGKRFAMQAEQGPRREEGQSYQSFKARWLEDYENRIEQVLAGDPRSIVLRGRWKLVLAQAEAARLPHRRG